MILKDETQVRNHTFSLIQIFKICLYVCVEGGAKAWYRLRNVKGRFKCGKGVE